MTIAFLASASLMIALTLSWLLRPLGPRVGTLRRHRKTNAALLAIVPSSAIALYAWLGRIDAIEPPIDAGRAAAEAMVARLSSRLDPDDVPGLRLLARSHLRSGRPAEAVRTWERLSEIRPDDAALESDYAEALALAANEAVERDDPDAAIRYWTRLRTRVPTGSPLENALRRNIVEAGERAAAKRAGR